MRYAICIMLVLTLAGGCITTHITGPEGTTTTTRRMDTAAVSLCWELIRAGTPEAIDWVDRIQALLDKPDEPTRAEKLAEAMEQARRILEQYNASKTELPDATC